MTTSIFSGLHSEDGARAFAQREVDRFLLSALRGPRPQLVQSSKPTDDELSADRAFNRRREVFDATAWTLEEALCLFIDFSDYQSLASDDVVRQGISIYCRPPHDPVHFLNCFEGSEPLATALVEAVRSTSDFLATINFSMAPLMWMRWLGTYAPGVELNAFWTEFGVWRSEQNILGSPTVRALLSGKNILYCVDSGGFARSLIPLDTFIRMPMSAHDFGTSLEYSFLCNENSIKAGLVNYLLSSNEFRARAQRSETRMSRAIERLGSTAVGLVGQVVRSLQKKEGKKLGWEFSLDESVPLLLVSESREYIYEMFVAEAAILGLPIIPKQTAFAAFPAYFKFRRGRRKQPA